MVVGASRCFNIGRVEGSSAKGAVGSFDSTCEYERIYYTGDFCKGFGAWVARQNFKASFYVTILNSEGFDFSSSTPSVGKVQLTIDGLRIKSKSYSSELLYDNKKFVPFKITSEQKLKNDICFYPTNAETKDSRCS